MIVENAIERHGYARILLSYYHHDGVCLAQDPQDMGCKGYVRIITAWDSYEMRELNEALAQPSDNNDLLNEAFNKLYPNLHEAYYKDNSYSDYNDSGDWGSETNLTIIQGSFHDLDCIFSHLLEDLQEGHFSGDDTVYDYWPSGFGALVAFAKDLDTIADVRHHIDMCRSCWDKRAAQFTDRGNPDDFAQEITPRP